MLIDFYEKYFLVNLKDYPNIGIDFEITKIIFYFTLGIIIASIAINYIRSQMYTVVKSLMRREAFSTETALTLDELGINTAGVRRTLKSGSQLMKAVTRIGKTKSYSFEEYLELMKKKNFKDEEINFAEDKFYIHPSNMPSAEKIYMSGTASALHTALFSVLLLAIFVCLMFLMPEILTLINNLLG